MARTPDRDADGRSARPLPIALAALVAQGSFLERPTDDPALGRCFTPADAPAGAPCLFYRRTPDGHDRYAIATDTDVQVTDNVSVAMELLNRACADLEEDDEV